MHYQKFHDTQRRRYDRPDDKRRRAAACRASVLLAAAFGGADISGAKNAALPLMAASLLMTGP